MARQRLRGKGLDTFTAPVEPSAAPNFQEAFQFVGMNTVAPATRMPPGFSRLVRNMVFREGAYETREGTFTIGEASTTQQKGVFFAVFSSGTTQIYRFLNDKVQKFEGIWSDSSGDPYTADGLTHVSRTGWGDGAIISGQDGLYNLAFVGSGIVTAIADTPTGVIHLTTFNRRVIASTDTRIQWSVNGNSEDWTGLGSGYEDLRSTPGGVQDRQTAVVPITDGIALVIRSNSIWQMQPTGNFDAPFSFTMLYSRIGSKYPKTVVGIPQGAIAANDQSIWLLTLSGFEDIGAPIRNLITGYGGYMNGAVAAYDEKWGEYRLAIGSRVLRYNLTSKLWTEDVYPFDIRDMAYGHYIQGVSPGGPDESTDVTGGFVYAPDGDGRLTIRDHVSVPMDVNAVGVETPITVRLETGNLIAENPLFRVGITEVQVEYESDDDFTGIFEYSTDSGETWVLLSVQPFSATGQPTLQSIMRWVERDTMQLSFSCAAAPNIRLIGMYPAVVKGARKGDAR